jgi:hypothetical protein
MTVVSNIRKPFIGQRVRQAAPLPPNLAETMGAARSFSYPRAGEQQFLLLGIIQPRQF